MLHNNNIKPHQQRQQVVDLTPRLWSAYVILTAVPVLDALAQVPGLRVVNCNSELAAAYAAGRQLQQLIAGRSYLLLMRCNPTQLQLVLMSKGKC